MSTAWPAGEDPIGGEGSAKKQRKAARARRRRLAKIRSAAESALARWRLHQGLPVQAGPEPAPREPGDTGLLQPLPRPRGLGVKGGARQSSPPRRHEETFKAGLVRSMGRVFLWLLGFLRFALGLLWDRLRRRDSEERRAWRLRQTFETMGTTFIKFGQQLSMRLDLLPYAYTSELEKMLDKVPPFPTEEAISTIERATGKPMAEIFSAFDPEPIGSASVACVYQATLKNGDRVAIKVRRPGIGELLAADMRALKWLMVFAELFIVPPGFTTNFLYELRAMLMEELDFSREARFTDLFRRGLRKTKQLHYASAPRVYFEFSRVDVLVTEYVSGIWLQEILTALATRDQQALDRLEAMDIDPLILARRFLLISRFGNFEHIFFHADLHPANILVQPGNKIVLIDFGSCGSFTKKELVIWRRLFDAQSLDDVGGMVQAGLSVIEPLPPIDKDEFALRLESVFWNDLYAIKSKHSEWWERISARIWISFLKLAREYRIPMRLNILRMIRAIMLADTIAARLDNDLDPYREYRYYEKGAGKRAKKRTEKTLRRLAGPGKFIRIEQGMEAALNAIYQAQRLVSSLRSIGFVPLIGKAAFAVFNLLKLVFILGTVAVAATLVVHLGQRWLTGASPTPSYVLTLWYVVLKSRYFQFFAFVASLVTARIILHRTQAREV